MLKTLTDEEAFHIIWSKFAQLRRYDIIDLFDGHVRSPAIVTEIFADCGMFKFMRLDQEAVMDLMEYQRLPAAQNILRLPVSPREMIKIMWTNITPHP